MMVLNSVYGMMNPEYRSYSKNVVDAVVVIISRYQVHMVFPADCINIIQFHKSYAQSHVLWCLFVCFDWTVWRSAVWHLWLQINLTDWIWVDVCTPICWLFHQYYTVTIPNSPSNEDIATLSACCYASSLLWFRAQSSQDKSKRYGRWAASAWHWTKEEVSSCGTDSPWMNATAQNGMVILLLLLLILDSQLSAPFTAFSISSTSFNSFSGTISSTNLWDLGFDKQRRETLLDWISTLELVTTMYWWGSKQKAIAINKYFPWSFDWDGDISGQSFSYWHCFFLGKRGS